MDGKEQSDHDNQHAVWPVSYGSAKKGRRLPVFGNDSGVDSPPGIWAWIAAAMFASSSPQSKIDLSYSRATLALTAGRIRLTRAQRATATAMTGPLDQATSR